MKKESSIGEKLARFSLATTVLFSPIVPNRHPEQLFEQRDNSPNLSGHVVFAASLDTAPPQPTPSPIPNPSLSPAPSPLESPTPSPEPTPTLSPVEKRQQKIKQDLIEINKILDANSNIFSNKYKTDINLYYPIYKPIADKFKIDWYLLFIVHEKETGASAGTRGFAPNSYYIGAMQIAPYWQEFASLASKGLEDLKKLPQRHKNDWEQIALGGWILNRNIDYYVKLGNERAVFNAIRLYSPGSYNQRFELYKKYKKLFG